MHSHIHLTSLLILILIGVTNLRGQTIAIISPDENETGKAVGQNLNDGLRATGVRTIDNDLAFSAFRSTRIENPFNMSASEVQRLAAVVGSNYVLLIKADRVR